MGAALGLTGADVAVGGTGVAVGGAAVGVGLGCAFCVGVGVGAGGCVGVGLGCGFEDAPVGVGVGEGAANVGPVGNPTSTAMARATDRIQARISREWGRSRSSDDQRLKAGAVYRRAAPTSAGRSGSDDIKAAEAPGSSAGMRTMN